MQTSIFVGVGVYLLLMIGVGIYAGKKSHTATEFMLAGRGLTPMICTATIIATWFGGGSMIGSSGAAYDTGILGVIADPFGAAFCLLLIGFFFARTFRRLNVVTTADYMRQRYGAWTGIALTLVALFSNTVWVGSMLVAFGLLFESLTGTPLVVGIVGGAAVILLYTSVGGMWAVALTDFVQMIIIVAGLLILLVTVLIDVGGWQAIAAQLPEQTFRFTPLDHARENWLNYLRAWLIVGLVDISAQTLFQRAAAARDEQTAQNSFYFGCAAYLVFGMVPVLLGIIASVSMPGMESAEGVLPAMALQHLHPVMVAIFVGALLAAIMSSGDSALLACASLMARNVYPYFKPDHSDRQSLVVARLSIPLFGAIAIAIALNAQVVYDLALDSNILGLACIIVPYICGLWWRKANRLGALAAVLAGLGAWLLTLLLAPQWPADLLGLAASFTAMFVVAPLTQEIDPPRVLCDGNGDALLQSDRLGTLPLFRRQRASQHGADDS